MIRKSLLLKLFSGTYMQRWNDKIRPVEFTEMDKQAHKMFIAFFLGKMEEPSPELDWTKIIEGGIFEFLQRIVLTDLKPPIFYKIKESKDKYKQLNDWVFLQLGPVLSSLGTGFSERFRVYFTEDDQDLNRRILNAAHFYATKWEFDILYRANPGGYEMEAIRTRLEEAQNQFCNLQGIQCLRDEANYRNFIDLCGHLRFQLRWANIHRTPRTSVLGHSLFVAILSYLLSLELSGCSTRCFNNFFTGLFHDLPEVLTRDIISPVKKSIQGLDELIKEYEREMMEKELYRLIPSEWHPQIRMFTEHEFESIIFEDGTRVVASSSVINDSYNDNGFCPRDGELVKASDRLAAFIEAYVAIRNGSAAPQLQEALWTLRSLDSQETLGGINFAEIYADFD